MLFALDSIPAVFGVTSEAYIVFAANAFALLGLRALYFMVTGLLDRLVYLSAGLAVILAFIGAKLILHWAHGLFAIPQTNTALSLAVIGGVLAITTAASLIKSRRDPGARAHAGAVLGTQRADPARGQPRSGAAADEAGRPGWGIVERVYQPSGRLRALVRHRGDLARAGCDNPGGPSETAIIALGVATAGSTDPRIALLGLRRHRRVPR